MKPTLGMVSRKAEIIVLCIRTLVQANVNALFPLGLASERYLLKIWRQEDRGLGYSSPAPASFLVQVLTMATPIHSYSFCLVGPRAQPASQWQGKCFSALSGTGGGQPPAVARLWEPQYSYRVPQPCPPSPFIKMSLLDHLREFVIRAGISNDGRFKRASNSAWNVVNAP